MGESGLHPCGCGGASSAEVGMDLQGVSVAGCGSLCGLSLTIVPPPLPVHLKSVIQRKSDSLNH